MKDKLFLLAALLLVFVSPVISANVGTVPGSVNFGEIERGETVSQRIYVTTNFQRTFTVSPDVSESYSTASFEDFGLDSDTVSEESIEDWINPGEDIEINPGTTKTYELSGGGQVNARGYFVVEVSVPNDAEPGIHHAKIYLNPSITGEGSGTGTTNWGEITPSIQFSVPGNAERRITVEDVRAFRLGQDSAEIEVLMRNDGTVTTSVQNFEIDIFDSRRDKQSTISVSGARLAPGESQWLDATWGENQEIPEGTYQIDGAVNYMTGEAMASGRFSLPGINRIEVRPEQDSTEQAPEQDSVPIWFVLIVLVILGVLMWGFEIEPFWIIAILGVLGISAFILITGLPNYLLIILLAVVGIVIYGGM